MADIAARIDTLRLAYRKLRPSERVILPYIARSYTNAEIAKALGLTEDTIKTHLQVIYRIYGCNRRVCLAVSIATRENKCRHPK